jgi:23S rRNA (uracil1939-C5)-methyltransferase
MLKAGETLSLTIEKPAAGGPMIARHEGRVILVSGAIPGERVTARLTRVSKAVAYAETIRVDEPSPDRRAPPGDPLCGGCLYNHIAYARQLTIKSDVIADAFKRIGRIELPAAVAVAASREDGYRMRARLHVRGSRAGFFREGTHDLCDARATRQLLPATFDVVDRLIAAIRSIGADAVREIELSENLDATERVAHLDLSEPLDGRLVEKLVSIEGLTPGPYVTDGLQIDGASLRLRRHVLAFFQGNRYLLADLVAQVTRLIPAGAPLLDLYAGVGLFSVAAAAVRGAAVTAVEGDAAGFEDLRANASSANGKVTAVRAAVEDITVREADIIIVDPPRTGMSAEALQKVMALKPSRLIYVSCDVATLARDSKKIVDAGYAIERADAFDMFPNTPHVETVIAFTKS